MHTERRHLLTEDTSHDDRIHKGHEAPPVSPNVRTGSLEEMPLEVASGDLSLLTSRLQFLYKRSRPEGISEAAQQETHVEGSMTVQGPLRKRHKAPGCESHAGNRMDAEDREEKSRITSSSVASRSDEDVEEGDAAESRAPKLHADREPQVQDIPSIEYNSVVLKDSIPSQNISQDIEAYSAGGLCASYAKRCPSDTVTATVLQDPAVYPGQPSETSSDGSDSDADWDANEPFMPFEMDCSVDAFEE